MAADNKSLGRFILEGVPPAPRGVPQVEVTFDIDANGILNVTAKDKSSGKEQSIRIEAGSGLSDEEVEKMKQDAEGHKEEDQKKKEAIEVRNTAEQLMYTAEHSLKEYGEKISDTVKSEVEEKIKSLREIKEKDDLDATKKATEELSTTLGKIGQAMAGNQQQADARPAGPVAQGSGGHVRAEPR